MSNCVRRPQGAVGADRPACTAKLVAESSLCISQRVAESCRWQEIIVAICQATVISLMVFVWLLELADCRPGSGSACGDDPNLNSFPSGSSLVAQALWVTRRMAWLPWYLGLYHDLENWSIITVLHLFCAVCAWKQFNWYIRGGRNIMLQVLRLVISGTLALGLLAGVSRGSVHHAFLQCSHGNLACAGVLFAKSFLLKVPLHIHIRLVCLELVTSFYVHAMANWHTSTRQDLLSSFVVWVIMGLVVPTMLLVWEQRSLEQKISRPLRVHGYVAHGSGQTCTAPRVSSGGPGASSSQAATAALQGAGKVTFTAVDAVFAAVPTSSTVAPQRSLAAVYHSPVTLTTFSMKIGAHKAYNMRDMLAPVLENAVTRTSSPSNAPLVCLRTNTWSGCLQLILTITHTAPRCTTTGPRSVTRPEDPPSPHLDPLQILHECLESFSAMGLSSTALVHNPASGTMAAKLGVDAPVCVRQLPGQFRGGTPNQLWVDPMCFIANVEEPTVAFLMLPVGWTPDVCAAVCPVEVTMGFQHMGRGATVQQKLEKLDNSVRLCLPTNMSPSPVSVFMTSTKPGMEGVLLGSSLTMALPQPAVRELQSLFQRHSVGDSMRQLLQDMAEIWFVTAQLRSADQQGTAWQHQEMRGNSSPDGRLECDGPDSSNAPNVVEPEAAFSDSHEPESSTYTPDGSHTPHIPHSPVVSSSTHTTNIDMSLVALIVDSLETCFLDHNLPLCQQVLTSILQSAPELCLEAHRKKHNNPEGGETSPCSTDTLQYPDTPPFPQSTPQHPDTPLTPQSTPQHPDTPPIPQSTPQQQLAPPSDSPQIPDVFPRHDSQIKAGGAAQPSAPLGSGAACPTSDGTSDAPFSSLQPPSGTHADALLSQESDLPPAVTTSRSVLSRWLQPAPTPITKASNLEQNHSSSAMRGIAASVIWGFPSSSTEEQYRQYLGGASTKSADFLVMLYFAMLAFVHLVNGELLHSHLFVCMVLGLNSVAFAILLSPIRPCLWSYREAIVCGTKAATLLTIAASSIVVDRLFSPSVMKHQREHNVDMVFYLLFPLLHRVRFGAWVCVAAAAEFVFTATIYCEAIGFWPAVIRTGMGYSVSLVGCGLMDWHIRKGFLRAQQQRTAATHERKVK